MSYRKPVFEFNSVFAPYIRNYIELRESLGSKFRVQSGLLRQFDRYCVAQNYDVAVLGDQIANDWFAISCGEKESSRTHRISTLKLFAEYLRSIGIEAPWIPRPGYCSRKRRYIPYIFAENEVRRILAAADSLPKPTGKSMFHLVFPAILRVLYGCGLRVTEVLSLRLKDIDLKEGFIHVEQAKFDNHRYLPISESLKSALNIYACANSRLIGIDADGFFFPNALREQYSQRTVYDKFRTILWKSGIPHQGKGKGPRVHDLRHTFAVHSLRKNIQAGQDMYVALPVLMTYLGHGKLSSTEYYLRLTAEIFPDFLEKADTVCAAMIPEVAIYED